MKILFFPIFLLTSLFSDTNDPRKIAKINTLKKEASEAFLKKNFEKSAQKYAYMYDSLHIVEDEILMNLAHSQYLLNDTSLAIKNYTKLSQSENNKLKSIALQQLGVIKKEENKLEESLKYLKYSLKSNSNNHGARYDYEVVKKLLEDQKKDKQNNKNQKEKNKENKDKKNKDQQGENDNKDQKKEDKKNEKENQQNKDQQGEKDKNQKEKEQKEEKSKDNQEKKDGEKSEAEKKEEQKKEEKRIKNELKKMNINIEQAKMILEAMKNSEIQYLQQQKRKPSKQPSRDKPDW